MSQNNNEEPKNVDNASTMYLSAIDDVVETPDRVGDSVPRVDETLPADTALLIVRRGPNAGSRFLLDTDVTTAGRHPESDIFLDDVTVSRRHAEFHRDGGVFSVRDVGSLNGTYVNRERVETAILTHADEVQIGKFRFIFVIGLGQQNESTTQTGREDSL